MRVSTKEQANNGFSLENQYDYCMDFAKSKGWFVPENLIFKENISASKINNVDYTENTLNLTPTREGIRNLLISANNKEFKHLIVFTRDRLSRVTEEALSISAMLGKNKIDIHYSKPGEEVNNENDAVARFMNLIMLSISEYESTLISTRVKNGNKKCLLEGYWPGGVTPIGYIRRTAKFNSSKIRSKLQKSNFETTLVKRIYELYNDGFGYKRIADIMNKEHGYIYWSKSKIETIINNQSYTGSLHWDKRGGKRNPIKHKNTVFAPYNEDIEIINNKDWQMSSKLRKERNETKDPNIHLTNYILKNKIYCNICNNKMKPVNPGKNKTPVYLCQHCKDEKPIGYSHRIPCSDVEDVLLSHFKSECFTNKAPNKFLYYKYLSSINELNAENENFIIELNKHIEEVNLKVLKLKSLISSLSPADDFINPLNEQKVIYEEIINEYSETKKYFQNKLINKQLTEDEFYNLFKDWKDKLFNNNLTSNDLTVYRRKFINTFIDKVYVRKPKHTSQIIIDKIFLTDHS